MNTEGDTRDGLKYYSGRERACAFGLYVSTCMVSGAACQLPLISRTLCETGPSIFSGGTSLLAYGVSFVAGALADVAIGTLSARTIFRWSPPLADIFQKEESKSYASFFKSAVAYLANAVLFQHFYWKKDYGFACSSALATFIQIVCMTLLSLVHVEVEVRSMPNESAGE